VRLLLLLSIVIASSTVARANDAPTPPPAQPQPQPQPQLVPPKLTRFVDATPPEALKTRERAEVILTIDVDDKGKVTSVTVAQPAGDGFDEAAVEAAKQFEFTPGVYDGKPVPVRITYKYKFLYKPAPAPTPTPVAPGAAPEPPKPKGVPLAGVVREKGERVALPGITVLLDDGAIETTTDENGRFELPDVPPGPHVLRLRARAIQNADVKLTLSEGKRLDTTIYVSPRERYVSVVRAARPVVETVETVLSGDEVRRIPGTQGDTVKAVQNLPGVARSPFGGGLLVVWGSNPADTRTYVDGVFIPTLFHFGGLRSTVNSEIVNSISFRPGGYGAEYGRGTGGVVEIETRRAKDKGVHGFAQLDLIDASLFVEGNLPKNVSIAAGLRRSTIDAWLPYVTPNDFQIVPSYYDYQLKLNWRATPKDELEIFAFGSIDIIRLALKNPDPALEGSINSDTFYHRVLARYTRRFSLWGRPGQFFATVSTGYDVPVQVRGGFGNTDFVIDVRLCPYTLRSAVRLPLTDFLRLDAGVDFEGTRFSIEAKGSAAGAPREGDAGGGFGGANTSDKTTLWTNHFAPFVALNFNFWKGKLLITPQLRLDIYSFTGYQGSPDGYSNTYVQLQPRLTARWQALRWMALKASVGAYGQPQDIVSMSVRFGAPKTIQPQQSWHYVFGFDFDPTSTLHIEAVAFYKDLRQLVVRADGPYQPPLDNDGIGRVYGADFLVRQQLWKGLFGWIAYTALRAERKDHPSEPWRVFQFDQTHIFTLIASYKFKRGYQVGLRFRYVTGNPTTPVVGSYFDANAGQYRRINGETYSARNSDFHQLDVRFDKTWTYDTWKLSFYLDIQNLYNYRSAEGVTYNFDFTRSEPLAGLPIVPALGIRGEW
jgi:TonB family protein